jgi:3-hydroxymyristoyl/3-hydroxydecanoyl-(acyl carrier protein) dehydratase
MNARESENYLAISLSSSASTSVEMLWAEIYRGRLFLGPNLVSFNRTVVPCEISKVNIRVETKILVSMSEEIKKIDRRHRVGKKMYFLFSIV